MTELEETVREPEKLPPQTLGMKIKQGLYDMLVMGMAFLLFITFVMQTYAIEGASMEPTLLEGERVIAEKLSTRFGEIERGDVVVLLFPADVSKRFVKRVIAVPGDTVEVRHGRTVVNKKMVKEPYVPDEFRSFETSSPIVVPPGYYFVMGDHRTVSYDSRQFGFVPQRYILGRAIFAIWPPQKFGLIR